MTKLAISVFFSVVILALFQILFTVLFVQRLKPVRLMRLPDSKATVILCLRGVDRSLSDCLQGLLNQDYPNYTVLIVVESPTDPVWEVITPILTQPTIAHVQVSLLKERLETCSFKCSQLIQAIATLDSDCEIVALIDADTVPHSTWLRELVTPLQNDRIGATTGNSWYSPEHQMGNVFRYLWNASNVVMMYFNQIPWSGSIAFKTDLIYQTNLLEIWKHALSEVVPLHRVLRKQKQRIQFVPSLMMVHSQSCEFSSFWRWAVRQMLMIRLYHSAWWGTSIASVINTLVIGRAMVLFSIAALTGQWSAMIWIGSGLAFYIVVTAGLVSLLQQGVVRAKGERSNRISMGAIARCLIAIPFAQFVQTGVLVAALLTKTLKWQGITYQISDPWNIQALPCQSAAKPTEVEVPF
ncbi:glycosyltransferase [Phormidesmis priestleyi]